MTLARVTLPAAAAGLICGLAAAGHIYLGETDFLPRASRELLAPERALLFTVWYSAALLFVGSAGAVVWSVSHPAACALFGALSLYYAAASAVTLMLTLRLGSGPIALPHWIAFLMISVLFGLAAWRGR